MTATPTPAVSITLDGKQYALRYTNAALVKLEDVTGQTIAEIGQRATLGSVKAINQMLWAALLHESPDLKLSDVVQMVDAGQYEDIAGVLAKAMEAAFGREKSEGNAVAAA